jgi:hypothetical protein
MLAAAVSMVCARRHAAAVATDLVLGAIARAGLLTDNYFWQPTPCNDGHRHQCSLKERPAMTETGQLLSKDIESARIHQIP